MARNFDESDDYIEITSDSSVNGLSQYSIAMWATRESGGEGGYGCMAYKGTTSSPNRYWRWENDNEGAGWGLAFIVEWSSSQGAWSIDYPDTAYHNYVITYDSGDTGNDPIIYKDGTSVTVTDRLTPSGTLATDNTELNIGSNTARAQTWDGSIAEFAIWNRILTAAEAKGIGAGFSPLFYPNGLVLYTPLIGRSSPEIELIKGTGGTVNGAVVAAHPPIIYPSASQMIKFGGAVDSTVVKDLIMAGIIPFAR